MVFTRSQIENLSREELIEELVKLSDITDQLKDLTDKFDNCSKKYEELKKRNPGIKPRVPRYSRQCSGRYNM